MLLNISVALVYYLKFWEMESDFVNSAETRETVKGTASLPGPI